MAWVAKFSIKDLLETEEDVGREEAKRLGNEVAKRLETDEALVMFGVQYTNKLIRLFRYDCLSQHDFNAHLGLLYDYADYKRIWVE